jgi:lysine 6-dehydrogenase
MRALILGAGRIGRALAVDLAAEPSWRVTVADVSRAALEAVAAPRRTADPSRVVSAGSAPSETSSTTAAATAVVETVEADLSDPGEVTRLAADHDLVVGALPSFLGFNALRAVLEAGRPCADISFFEEDPFELDGLARERGVTAVVDCGIAPGCDHLIAGRHAAEMHEVERFRCYVGGLPAERSWPWEYKAPFAPYDVLAEYTRPARYVAGGERVVRPALSEPELLDFPGLGTLEAFNTDGLRTLLTTLPIPDMQEKTLRYPGHAEKMRALRESGFFSPEPVDVDGAPVSPLALTSKLLFHQWRLEEGEEDLTVMRVEVDGRTRSGAGGGARRERHTYDLLDRADPRTGLSSMARTTGFTCAAVARLVADGTWDRPGVSAPEHIGGNRGCFERVMAELADRGVRFRTRVATL